MNIKFRVLNKFVELKNHQNTIIKLTIIKAKLIELLLPYHNTLNGVLKEG